MQQNHRFRKMTPPRFALRLHSSCVSQVAPVPVALEALNASLSHPPSNCEPDNGWTNYMQIARLFWLSMRHRTLISPRISKFTSDGVPTYSNVRREDRQRRICILKY